MYLGRTIYSYIKKRASGGRSACGTSTHTHTDAHIHTRTHRRTHTDTHTHTHTHTDTHTHTQTRTQTRTHTHTHTRTHTRTRTRTQTHTRTHTRTHTGHWAFGKPLSIAGFPCGSGSKESACNVGDLGSTPRLGKQGSLLDVPGLGCVLWSSRKSSTAPAVRTRVAEVRSLQGSSILWRSAGTEHLEAA